MNPEDQKITEENKDIFELVNHAGWKVARAKIVQKILDLQNVAEYVDIIQTGNATRLLREMKANKRVAEILFDFLREIEGSAQVHAEQKPISKSYLFFEEGATNSAFAE